jgi:tetratricopeptide (TPR) repeat protein
MREIELTGWSNNSFSSQDENDNKDSTSRNNGSPVRPAMLYSPVNYPSVIPVEGSDVLCPYGRGRVIEVRRRSADQIMNENEDSAIVGVVIRLSSWRLARRCTVTCYIDIALVQTVRLKRIYEMSVVEKIEHAMELKQEAAIQFGQRKYESALNIYARAVDAVKYVQHKPDSTNIIRADLLVVMITCSNNAATCCTQLEKWDEATKHAQQAVALLDALETKKGSRIHQELYRQGNLDIRLFGEWKVKSLLILARSLTEKDEVEAAMDAIKKARDIIATYTADASPTDVSQKRLHLQSTKQLCSNDKELLKLYARCKERRKVQLRKERMRAQAMFASSTSTNNSNASSTSPPAEKATSLFPSSNKLVRDGEEKKSDAASSQMEMNDIVRAQFFQNSATSQEVKDVTDETITSSENIEDLPWHSDPYLLGGLGVVIGTIGTLLLLSQLAVLPKPRS